MNQKTSLSLHLILHHSGVLDVIGVLVLIMEDRKKWFRVLFYSTLRFPRPILVDVTITILDRAITFKVSRDYLMPIKFNILGHNVPVSRSITVVANPTLLVH